MRSGPAPKPTCKPELVKETHYTGVVEVPSAATPSAAPSPQNEERNHSPSTPDQRLDVPLMDYLSSLGKPDLLQLQEVRYFGLRDVKSWGTFRQWTQPVWTK